MERIKVAIRIRPFLSNENKDNTGINMNPDDDNTIMITNNIKTFKGTFDKILSVDSTQKDVFEFIEPCLVNIKNSKNCTILTYGQTGSGKTYTMLGGDWSFNENFALEKNIQLAKEEFNFIANKELVIDPSSESNGIIPNLILQLFNIYNKKNNESKKEDENKNEEIKEDENKNEEIKEDENKNEEIKEDENKNEEIKEDQNKKEEIKEENNNLNIKCSYIQIYNEKIYDLLPYMDEINNKKDFEVLSNKNKSEVIIKQNCLKIKYDKIRGIILDGINEIKTNSFFDLFDILALGETNRKIRHTNQNDMSSRSHTVFTIDIEDKISQIKSKIKLCDLAGSERFDSSAIYNKAHIFEMRSINKSLFVLGNIIQILASKKKAHKYIPYKDSKLTRILEESLSGNSSIYLIATISPKDDDFNETINTLKFADKAHQVMVNIAPNKILNEEIVGEANKKEINKLYNEIEELKQLLLLRERRQNLNPLQAEFLKLKKENNQFKKYLGGENNKNMFEKLIRENNNLKKEIKVLTNENNLLKNEKRVFFNENNKIDYNGMILEVKKKNLKNSFSANNIFNNYKKKNKMTYNNSARLINTGKNIVNNNKNIENGIVNYNGIKKIDLSNEYKYTNDYKISNNKNKKRLKSNKSNYNLNYNKINLASLGIKKKFYKNSNIIESLKRLKILEDLSNNK